MFPKKHINQLIEIMKEKKYEKNTLIELLNQKFPEFKIEDIKLLLEYRD